MCGLEGMELFISSPGGGEGDRETVAACVEGRMIIPVDGLVVFGAEKLLVKSNPESARQEDALFVLLLPTASTRLGLDLGISGSESMTDYAFRLLQLKHGVSRTVPDQSQCGLRL